eukprot:COSAG05_NODE_391_length_10419_cov_8.156686_2_plen_148_part_00
MNLFKSLRLFDPRRAHELQMSGGDVDAVFAELPALGRTIDATDRDAMKRDLSKYLSLGAQFVRDTNDMHAYTASVLDFWRNHKQDLHPSWALAARIAFAISPNSASSERVFSLMKRLYGRHQLRDSSLSDIMSVTMKLNYNHRFTNQ